MNATAATPDGELAAHQCWELLRSAEYGRLAVVTSDGPMIYPINAFIDAGTVVFRTASGEKLDAISTDGRVAFEIDGYSPDTELAWSVIIRGDAKLVTHQFDALAVAELGVTPWQGGDKAHYVRVSPTSVTGRRFQRTSPDQWTPTTPVQSRPTPDE